MTTRPLPFPHAFSTTILSPQQTSNQTNLKKTTHTQQDTGQRSLLLVVVWKRSLGRLCRPVFVRTVFLDSPVQIITTQVGRASPVTLAPRAVGFETERPTTNGGEYCGMLCCGQESPRASLCTRPPLTQSKGYCTL